MVSGEIEEPPTTYTIKGKYNYFKPKVEVETEEEGNKSHIKEIYIRGELELSNLIEPFIFKNLKVVNCAEVSGPASSSWTNIQEKVIFGFLI